MIIKFSCKPLTDVPLSMSLDDGGHNIVVSAKSYAADSIYVTLRYEQHMLPQVLDSDSAGQYIDGQVLVRFNPAYINTTFVDDKDKTYDAIEKVLDEAVIDSLSLRCGVDLHGSILTKMIPSLRRADSISISRGGDTIPVPKFWSSMILSDIPVVQSRSIQGIRNSLDAAQPYVFYAGVQSRRAV